MGALIIGAAGYYGVQASARLGTVLGAFEILVFVVLAVLLVAHAGSANTGSVFTTAHTPADHRGGRHRRFGPHGAGVLRFRGGRTAGGGG